MTINIPPEFIKWILSGICISIFWAGKMTADIMRAKKDIDGLGLVCKTPKALDREEKKKRRG